MGHPLWNDIKGIIKDNLGKDHSLYQQNGFCEVCIGDTTLFRVSTEVEKELSYDEQISLMQTLAQQMQATHQHIASKITNLINTHLKTKPDNETLARENENWNGSLNCCKHT